MLNTGAVASGEGAGVTVGDGAGVAGVAVGDGAGVALGVAVGDVEVPPPLLTTAVAVAVGAGVSSLIRELYFWSNVTFPLP
ncbi:hypothetical protein D3C75_855120 [compost metagenome]